MTVPVEERTCKLCKERKPLIEFPGGIDIFEGRACSRCIFLRTASKQELDNDRRRKQAAIMKSSRPTTTTIEEVERKRSFSKRNIPKNPPACFECFRQFDTYRGLNFHRSLVHGVNETKICTTCSQDKNKSDYRAAGTRGGFQGACRECERIYSRGRKEANRDSNYFTAQARKHGITKDEVLALYDRSGGVCEICARELPLALDHCHTGGEVRGYLCTSCNAGLGNFRDQVKWLMSAISYLESRETHITPSDDYKTDGGGWG